MPRAASLVCLLLLLAGCGSDDRDELPTGPSLTVALSVDSAGLGDPVRLRVNAVVLAPIEPVLPIVGDSIGSWTILDSGAWKTASKGPWNMLQRDVVLTGLRLGFLGPDSLRLFGVGSDGETLRLVCEAPGLYVGGEIEDGTPVDPATAHDIRDVVSLGRPTWPWIVAGALLVALGLLFAIRRSRRRRPEQDAVPENLRLSPEEEFDQAIDDLLASGLLEEGRYREFYYGVSAATRLYLERIHDLPLLESTSDEMFAFLTPRISDDGSRKILRRWLQEGDLVKYARMERLQAEALDYLERSKQLVRSLPKPIAMLEAPHDAVDAPRGEVSP